MFIQNSFCEFSHENGVSESVSIASQHRTSLLWVNCDDDTHADERDMSMSRDGVCTLAVSVRENRNQSLQFTYSGINFEEINKKRGYT